MSRHVDNLLLHVPDLFARTILEIGSGRGKFILEMCAHNTQVTGFEKNPAYVALAQKRLEEAGYHADIIIGEGEDLPFPDNTFGFINMAEVIEHVEDPTRVLEEAFRVLEKGGIMYVSVPNRFGLKDPHFHLYGINWMPRTWADRLTHKSKENLDGKEAGHQRLSEMHYYTYDEFVACAEKIGFTIRDTRAEKIKGMTTPIRPFLTIVYRLLRPWYFDTFHFILRK